MLYFYCINLLKATYLLFITRGYIHALQEKRKQKPAGGLMSANSTVANAAGGGEGGDGGKAGLPNGKASPVVVEEEEQHGDPTLVITGR